MSLYGSPAENSDDLGGSPWPRPLKIVMLAACPFPTHQGTQVFVRHLSHALSRAGHDVHVVAYGYGDHGGDFSFVLHGAPVPKLGNRSGPHWGKPLADGLLLRQAQQVIQEHGCDVLHAHNVEALALGALLRLRCGVPLLYHSHNAMGAELPTYFRRPTVRVVAGGVGELLDRLLPQAADGIVTFDEDHRALHEIYGIPERRIFVIPPGLDGDEIRHADPQRVAALRARLGSGPLVLYAGNPDGYQNLELLWAAFARVRKQRPDVRLLIASHHPAEAFGIPPRSKGIIMHGFTDLQELRALFAIAAVGVCTRVLWTGTPIKVLNYLAAGVPVVACRNAARHLLSKGGGITVDPQPRDFARAIVHLLEHRRHRAVSRAFDRFRIERQIPLYEHAYWHMLHLPS